MRAKTCIDGSNPSASASNADKSMTYDEVGHSAHVSAYVRQCRAQSVAFWRGLIAKAWEGDEQSLLFFLTHPESETRTTELDAGGNRVVQYTWPEIPGEVRQDLVDVLVNRPFLKRGVLRKFDPVAVAILRDTHSRNICNMTRDQSLQKLATWTKSHKATVRDVIDKRRTYSEDKALLKEPDRIRRSGRKT